MSVSEERQIAERIKDFIKNRNPSWYRHIMLRNGRILSIDDYYKMVSAGKVNPQDVYVYIYKYRDSYKATFYYPTLGLHNVLMPAYLLKLGFHSGNFIAPATNLKYVAFVIIYEYFLVEKYLSVELVDLDAVVSNTNLRKIVSKVLNSKLKKIVSKILGKKTKDGEKKLTDEERDKIYDMFKSQQLFAGYTPGKAWSIIIEYYDYGIKLLAKEVTHIAIDYYRIFQPYTVCYDMDSWKEVDCWSIR